MPKKMILSFKKNYFNLIKTKIFYLFEIHKFLTHVFPNPTNILVIVIVKQFSLEWKWIQYLLPYMFC